MGTQDRGLRLPDREALRNNHDPAHPSWLAFIKFCGEMQHGDIEKLKIQDGLPVLAELATRKVKFL